MIEFVLGAVTGAIGGATVGNKLSNTNNGESERLKRENDRYVEEIEKIRMRLKDDERQVEDLLAANKRLRNQAKDMEADGDDVEDELHSVKAKLKSLIKQNEELNQFARSFFSKINVISLFFPLILIMIYTHGFLFW